VNFTRRLGFGPRVFCVGFVADDLALVYICLRDLRVFPAIELFAMLYIRGAQLTRPTIGFESYGQPHIMSANIGYLRI